MQPLPSDPGHPLRQAVGEVLQSYPDHAGNTHMLQLATGGFSGAVVVRLSRPGPAWPMAGSGETIAAVSPLILPAGMTGSHRETPDGNHPPEAAGETSGTMCLRRWPKGTSRHRVEALHRFVKWLSRSGSFPLAVPISNRDGQTLTTHEGMLWHMEPWLPGTADFHHQPEPERLQKLMPLLARLHEVAARYEAPPADRKWFGPAAVQPAPAIQNRRKLLELWLREKQQPAMAAIRGWNGEQQAPGLRLLAEETVDRIGRLARPLLAELNQAESLAVRVFPVLRDIWHDHVLWNGGEVSGLIDLSAACRDSVAADISRLLGSLVEDNRSLWDLALDGYRRQATLTSGEEALVPILDRSGVLLSAASWIDRHYLQNRGSLNLPAATDRLRRLSGRLARMLSDSY